MSKIWLCLVLFNLLSFFLTLNGEKTHNNNLTPEYNTGNCSFIDNVYFKLSCIRTINKLFDRQWNNDRAPAGTEYATWINKYYPDAAIFTFHRSSLFNCRKLKVKSIDYSIHAIGQVAQDSVCSFRDIQGDLHCLDIRISYPAALIAECHNRPYKDSSRLKFPVFFFTRPTESYASVKSVTKATLVLLVFGTMVW